jgi:hypothetical protein
MAALNVTVNSANVGEGAGPENTLQSFTSFKMATNYFLRNPSMNIVNRNTYGPHL